MAKRFQARRRATDDTSALAGWLFTDLLLGLVMIFLSAVAFTAFKSKDSASEPLGVECKEYVAGFIAKPLSITFLDIKDAIGIGAQIKTFVQSEQDVNGVKQTLKDAKVAVGIIYGFFDVESSSFAGVKRAKQYYSEFIKSDPINFPSLGGDGKVENMRFIGSAGAEAPRDGVRAELFFVYDSCSRYGPISSALP